MPPEGCSPTSPAPPTRGSAGTSRMQWLNLSRIYRTLASFSTAEWVCELKFYSYSAALSIQNSVNSKLPLEADSSLERKHNLMQYLSLHGEMVHVLNTRRPPGRTKWTAASSSFRAYNPHCTAGQLKDGFKSCFYLHATPLSCCLLLH
eukprot:scaffold181449_cov19-Tisochrysis_lutea.AAC.1